MKLEINNSGRKMSVEVKKLGVVGRFFGLMFRTSKTKNLLFDFGREVRLSLHSFFVFFPFLVLWLDSENNVLRSEIVKPFRLRVLPRGKFFRIVEIPLNFRNEKILKVFCK